VKVISTCWDPYPALKGFDSYEWLDQALDTENSEKNSENAGKFETSKKSQSLQKNPTKFSFSFTFVGRAPIEMKGKETTLIPPLNSTELAHVLRQHHIYLAASRAETASNALLEAMGCGLPVVYRGKNGGSHGELVRGGGLPFDSNPEILETLEQVANDYGYFKHNLPKPFIGDVARQYVRLFRSLLTI
jgi:glycosyltransferase involved in cell wall biosynthesis